MTIAEELNGYNEWCISEKGQWGLPIPYFYLKSDPETTLQNPEITRHVADIIRQQGSEAWYRLSVKELLPVNYDAFLYEKGAQIFDIHFDSALSWDYILL